MPKELTQFKKGNPGGPGRPRLTEEAKSLRRATSNDLMIAICQVLRMTPNQYKRLQKSDNSDLSLMKIHLAKTVRDGNFEKLWKMVEYVMGKNTELPKEIKDDKPIIDIKKFETLIKKGHDNIK